MLPGPMRTYLPILLVLVGLGCSEPVDPLITREPPPPTPVRQAVPGDYYTDSITGCPGRCPLDTIIGKDGHPFVVEHLTAIGWRVDATEAGKGSERCDWQWNMSADTVLMPPTLLRAGRDSSRFGYRSWHGIYCPTYVNVLGSDGSFWIPNTALLLPPASPAIGVRQEFVAADGMKKDLILWF